MGALSQYPTGNHMKKQMIGVLVDTITKKRLEKRAQSLHRDKSKHLRALIEADLAKANKAKA